MVKPEPWYIVVEWMQNSEATLETALAVPP